MPETNTDAPNFGAASNYTPPDYAISEADAHIAAEIMAQDVAALPSNFQVGDGVRLPDAIGMDGLPPPLREAARAKVAGVPADRLAEAEAAAVLEVLRENSLAIKSRVGFAPGVDPIWHEVSDIARDHNDALAEYDRLNDELAQVRGWETEEGPDGKPIPKPIPAAGADRRRAIAIRQRELLHRMALLAGPNGHGPEAQRRLDRALYESVERRKAADAQLAVREEAKALAAKMLHEEQVQRQADAIAKHKRPSGI